MKLATMIIGVAMVTASAAVFAQSRAEYTLAHDDMRQPAARASQQMSVAKQGPGSNQNSKDSQARQEREAKRDAGLARPGYMHEHSGG